jgi:hypothetical protein
MQQFNGSGVVKTVRSESAVVQPDGVNRDRRGVHANPGNLAIGMEAVEINTAAGGKHDWLLGLVATSL